MTTYWTQWLRRICISLAIGSTMLGGCASAVGSADDAVAVTAVNYTGNDLNAVLFMDPASEKVAGGSGADPYGGSGAMCCFSLPRKWHPGIKVKVRYDWWTGSSADRKYETITTEIPPYPTEEPGVLWALFYEDGSVQVFASAVDPGHAQWPGKIKHWPVPSREHKLKLWQTEYDDAIRGVTAFGQPTSTDAASLAEQWTFFSGLNQETKKQLQKFSGPSDPKFLQFVEAQRKESLSFYKERADALLRIKP